MTPRGRWAQPSEMVTILSELSEILSTLRAAGWRVAVHNDYSLNGVDMTFWLLTHPCGIYVKGEGRTDNEALFECERQCRQKIGMAAR